jgi:L-lactate dehydrogenase complex protein LldG
MNGDREAILSRVREALRDNAAPRRHEVPAALPTGVTTASIREWLPPVGDTIEDRVALFAQLSAMLKTEFHECGSIDEARERFAAMATAEGWKNVALHSGELTDALASALPAEVKRVRSDSGYDKNDLEACEAGLTGCDTLIAQTGSICVTSLSAGGRALSVLPPHHLVIARRSQLVADLPAAYEQLAAHYGEAYPSFISFISGPSRTGDIERILVLGAHGPKRLTVFLVP